MYQGILSYSAGQFQNASYREQTVNDYGQHTSQLPSDKFPPEEVGN